MAKHEDALRCMALGDERYVKDVLAMQLSNVDASGLDPKTHALVRLGALIALDASQSSFQWNAATALASGATVDEIVGVLIGMFIMVFADISRRKDFWGGGRAG